MTRPPCPYLASHSGQAWSLEFFPALTVPGSQNLQDRIIRLSSLEPGPAAISITWGAGGSTSERSLGLAEFIAKNVSGVEGILHLTCTNMEKEKVIEALDVSTPSPLHLAFSAASRCPELTLDPSAFVQTAKALGIKNILALRGGTSLSLLHLSESCPTGADKELSFALRG